MPTINHAAANGGPASLSLPLKSARSVQRPQINLPIDTLDSPTAKVNIILLYRILRRIRTVQEQQQPAAN